VLFRSTARTPSPASPTAPWISSSRTSSCRRWAAPSSSSGSGNGTRSYAPSTPPATRIAPSCAKRSSRSTSPSCRSPSRRAVSARRSAKPSTPDGVFERSSRSTSPSCRSPSRRAVSARRSAKPSTPDGVFGGHGYLPSVPVPHPAPRRRPRGFSAHAPSRSAPKLHPTARPHAARLHRPARSGPSRGEGLWSVNDRARPAGSPRMHALRRLLLLAGPRLSARLRQRLRAARRRRRAPDALHREPRVPAPRGRPLRGPHLRRPDRAVPLLGLRTPPRRVPRPRAPLGSLRRRPRRDARTPLGSDPSPPRPPRAAIPLEHPAPALPRSAPRARRATQRRHAAPPPAHRAATQYVRCARSTHGAASLHGAAVTPRSDATRTPRSDVTGTTRRRSTAPPPAHRSAEAGIVGRAGHRVDPQLHLVPLAVVTRVPLGQVEDPPRRAPAGHGDRVGLVGQLLQPPGAAARVAVLTELELEVRRLHAPVPMTELQIERRLAGGGPGQHGGTQPDACVPEEEDVRRTLVVPGRVQDGVEHPIHLHADLQRLIRRVGAGP